MLRPHPAAVRDAGGPSSPAGGRLCGASPSVGSTVARGGERNGAYRTGRYSAEAKAERRQVRMLIGGLRHPIDSSEQAPRHLFRHLFRR
jgi:hypothetical protein